MGPGLSDNLAFEVEIATIGASLRKIPPDDQSSLPDIASRNPDSAMSKVSFAGDGEQKRTAFRRCSVMSEIVGIPHAKTKGL